jgi:FkbM family methyltransferase|tara:strand:- start:571 stop:1176 length:606 start_codon:yes stop_codon:yes gene_type:complete
MIKIVVGCNVDLEFLDECKNNSNLTTYAFEPNQEITKDIEKLPTNYHLINKAVSQKNGEVDFYIHSDKYSSSVLEWGNAPQWGTIEKTKVESIRLDSFCKEKNIESIDYIHIDAQGADLDVLKSMGDYISVVSEGVCESLSSNSVFEIYKNQPSFDEITNFLISNGFEFYYEQNLDTRFRANEINIHFKKSDNPREITKMI